MDPANHRTYTTTLAGQTYHISTNPTLLSRQFINTAFDTKDMFWARPLPPAQLELMITSSYTLGVYTVPSSNPSASSDPSAPPSPSSPRTPSPTLDAESSLEMEMIGLARFATDFTTLGVLTDVYVAPSHRGKGVSTWLMQCVKDVIDEMEFLRRVFLVAEPVKEAFYARSLGVWNTAIEGERLKVMSRKRKGVEVASGGY